MISIFEFKGYPDYLRSYLKSLPKEGYGESKRIAEHLSVSSTFFSQILSQQRQLSPEQAQALAGYLGLNKLEANYLFYLVQLERAGSESLRVFLLEKLQEIKEQSLKLVNRIEPKKILSDHEKSVFYSSAIYSAVHLFCSTENGRSVDDIVTRFDITRAKVIEIVRFLSETGLIIEESEKFRMTTQSTHVAQGSVYLLRHHANWRLQAIQASEDLTDTELMFTGQVSLSKADFEILREEIAKFIKVFLNRVHASPADEIANINIDWFWIRK